jgi:hypothetical protein
VSPADLAFVEDIEKRIKAAEFLTQLSPAEQRQKRLCAIVREQGASIELLQDKLVDETAQRELVEVERDTLRERLAKLEDALGYAVTHLEAANELLFEEEVRGEEDGVGDIRTWIHEVRSTLLKK